MNQNICLNCGSRIDHANTLCPDCGFPPTQAVSPKIQKLLSEAYALLRESSFDEAKKAFEAILYTHPKIAEAYFGRLRARYHIRYTQNAEGKLVTVCPTPSGKNIENDIDYKNAMEYADEAQKAFLQALAEAIRQSYAQNQPSKNYANKFTLGEIDQNDAAPKKSKKPLIISAVLSAFLVSLVTGGILSWMLHTHIPGAEATCAEAQLCKLCKLQLAPATGVHTPGAEATCVEEQICTVCNLLLASPTGHRQGAWEISVFPTDTQNGLRISKCPDCKMILGQENITVSHGLDFSLNNDGTYSVSGIGSCEDTDIFIPAVYNGASVTRIEISAFRNCKSLTSVALPDSVTSIGHSAFSGCTAMTSVNIPDSVTSIENSAFFACSSLIGIDIPGGVTSIGASAFYGCSSLTNITISDSVTRIGAFAFEGCLSLTSITLPGGVTDIDDGTFFCCTALTGITIPKGVTTIGDWTFEDCNALTNITYGGTKAEWAAITFGSGWNSDTGTYTVTCTDGTVSK